MYPAIQEYIPVVAQSRRGVGWEPQQCKGRQGHREQQRRRRRRRRRQWSRAAGESERCVVPENASERSAEKLVGGSCAVSRLRLRRLRRLRRFCASPHMVLEWGSRSRKKRLRLVSAESHNISSDLPAARIHRITRACSCDCVGLEATETPIAAAKRFIVLSLSHTKLLLSRRRSRAGPRGGGASAVSNTTRSGAGGPYRAPPCSGVAAV